MASEPSFIASVSRLGLATEPLSRWSRPITMGAFNSPRATISLKARPRRARSPRPHLVEAKARAIAIAEPDPADPRRQALELDALPGHVEPIVQVLVVRHQL